MSEERLENHECVLTNRGRLTLSGVSEVASFNDESVCLRTLAGMLTVTGAGLAVGQLDLESGSVQIDGRIGALVYEDTAEKKKSGWLKRVFR